MIRDLVNSRLDGLTTRIQQRAEKRRRLQNQHLERKRMGRTRKYEQSVYVPKRKIAS
jgi:hypothetical protein